jgi:RNA polymerase sigma-70 factor (ECF subfamily)
LPIAQDQLVRLLIAERGKVLAYIRSIVRGEHLAEDVFQDVSILAIRKQDEIQDDVHFMKWIRTAARLEALNAVRRAKVRELTLDDGVLDALEAQWSRHDDDRDAQVSAALNECISALSPAAQRIIRERYESGRSVTELAKLMNRQIDSLYVAISRIYRTLSDCVARRISGDGGGSNGGRPAGARHA